MKISDLIGELHDLFGSSKQQSTPIQNVPNLQPAEPETEDQADTVTMVAPLQQKLELLKKAVDVDNYYDDGSEASQTKSSPVNLTLNVPQGQSSTKIELTINGQQVDELDQIKQLAGVPVASIFDAGDDEPLDS